MIRKVWASVVIYNIIGPLRCNYPDILYLVWLSNVILRNYMEIEKSSYGILYEQGLSSFDAL